MSKVTNVDLDDAVSDDEVLAAANGANGDMADAPLTTGEASLSDLRVELEVATDEPVAPLLLETDGQLDSGLVQDAGDMEVDDEVLQIGELMDPWIDPEFADEHERMEKVFGIDCDGERYREADAKKDKKGDKFVKEAVEGFKRCSIYAMDWAGDKLLVAAKDGPGIRLQDVERGEEERTWSGDWMSIRSDPNNPFVAAAVAWNGKFKLFDTRQQSQSVFDVDLKKTSTSMKDFLYLCWSPDSKNIALSNRNDQIYLLGLKKGDTNCLRLGSSKNMNMEVNQMVYSPSGDSLWVATGGNPGKLHIFPSDSLQKPERSVTAHNWTAISLACDPTGKYICSGGADGLITVWDPHQPLCLRCFLHPGQVISNVDFNYQGTVIAWGTGAGERSLTLMGANTAIPYYQDLTPATVTHLRWHGSKNVLAYSLNASQMSEDRQYRDRRGYNKDTPIIQLMKLPDDL